jgi:mono/diheme cytochrome c family protein
MKGQMIVLTVAALMPLMGGCREQQSFVVPEPSLERMLQQPRVDPFEASGFYEDGMGMRTPPRGALPVERTIGDPKIVVGMQDDIYVARVPIPVDIALIQRGRERFEILCAACHGITGDGDSVVAENMDQRKPPSLHEDRIRALAAGRLYRVVSVGYGLMPSYAAQLTVEERWAVVAYVHALQLSRHAEIAALPPSVRGELQKVTP